jgi:hypothetical protein
MALKSPYMKEFKEQVKQFLIALNTNKVLYGDDEFDEYVEQFFPSMNDHEVELLENYTGPPLDSLDEAAAKGDGDACKALHARSRNRFFKDGSVDILRRAYDYPEEDQCFEETMTIEWDTEGGAPRWRSGHYACLGAC